MSRHPELPDLRRPDLVQLLDALKVNAAPNAVCADCARIIPEGEQYAVRGADSLCTFCPPQPEVSAP